LRISLRARYSSLLGEAQIRLAFCLRRFQTYLRSTQIPSNALCVESE
jgi:hypothetical protein